MMNLLALALILSSMVAASFFSPPPATNPQILREGHRLIVVEFERQIPQASFSESRGSDISGEAKEKLLDAASVLPNVGQGLSQPQNTKVSSVFTDTKEKANQFEESAADAVKSVADRVKHNVAQIKDSVSGAVKSTAEEAKQKAVQIEESASVALKTAADKTKRKASQFHESARKAAKGAAETAVAASEDASGNISSFASKTADMAVAATGEIRRNLTDIIQRAWELGQDIAAFVSVGTAEAVRSAAAVAHLLGFATAYGTCVWVTFASNHVLASAMPRQQFGIVQSRIYPVYFRFLAIAVSVGLAGHILRGKERVQGYNLMAILATVLLNLVWLEPKATKVCSIISKYSHILLQM